MLGGILSAELGSTAEFRFNRDAQRPFQLAASIGMALCGPEQDESLSELLARADTRMYAAKEQRRQAAAH